MLSAIGDKIVSIIASLIAKLWEWFYYPFRDLHSFKSLIYGKSGDVNLAFGIFSSNEIKYIYEPGIEITSVLGAIAIIIGIIFYGMRFASNGVNPSNRTQFLEFLKDIIIVGILFANLSFFYQLILSVNYSIVDLFNNSNKELIELKNTIDDGPGVLGNLVINLCLLGLSVWANFYYMMRKLTIMLLVILGPFMIALYLIPQTRGITMGWIKELVGTISVQAIHAFLYWAVAIMSIGESGISGIILYIIFIPVAEALKHLFGLGGQMHGVMNKAGAMMGGAALMGMAGSIKGALNGKSVGETIRNLAGRRTGNGEGAEGEGKKGILANAGTDIGSTSNAEKMLKAGEIFSKAGKAAFGSAGAIAGSVMGPMGSIIGATAGSQAGGFVTGLAGRTGMAAGTFAMNRLQKGMKGFKDGSKGILNAENKASEKLANSIADVQTGEWAKENKDKFMKDMKERFPDAHESSINGLWDKELSGKKAEFLENARSTIGDIRKQSGNRANAKSLVNAATKNLTKDWAKNNREQFIKDFDKNSPLPANASEMEKQAHAQRREAAWNQAVNQKQNDFNSAATNVASSLTNGSDQNLSFINKDKFSEALARTISGNATPSRGDMQSVRNAVKGVKQEQLFSGKTMNRPFLTSQIASNETNRQRNAFIQGEISNGSSAEVAEMKWNDQAPSVFASNLKNIEQTMPKNFSLDNRIIQNSGARFTGAVAKGITSGIVSASGIKEASKFMADTKAGAFLTTSVSAIGANLSSARVDGGIIRNTLSPLAQGISGGIQNRSIKEVMVGASNAASGFKETAIKPITQGLIEGSNAAGSHVASNVIEKQAGFKNGVAFASGIVGGVNGYRRGASIGMKINPYNNAVNSQIREVSQIAHMAESIQDSHGNSIISSGAIKLVTTNDQSYIQVRDKTGHNQIVSRFGSGDSSLRKGEVIYQDLNVMNDSLVHGSSAYRLDSGGGRVPLNRQINVNPNQLLGNRNTPNSPRVVQEVQSYNQQVDSGQFFADDIAATAKNIRMVVTKNNSFLVGEDSNGKDYRLSPYGRGDARLSDVQVREVECTIRNRKIVKGDYFYKDENGNPLDNYTSSLTPSDLVPTRQNKRYIHRAQGELMRNKSLVDSLGR